MELLETIRENRELARKLVENLLAMKSEGAEIPVKVGPEEYIVKVTFGD